ncbi:MAG: sirohydrochlorin chelatase [Elusimicrobiota bacterium]
MLRARTAFAIAAWSLLLGIGSAKAKTPPPYGILLLAHGSGARWNGTIRRIRAQINAKIPTEIAFGMADADSIQGAINRLQSRGTREIAAVPLFINSRSEVMDQTRYVLGVSSTPSQVFITAMEHLPRARMAAMVGMGPDFDGANDFLKRARATAKIVMTPALDDDPLAAAILIKRAAELGRNPRQETLILVGHGPVDEAENAAWLSTMKELCRTIKKAGRYKAALAATIRDDSPPNVKADAAKNLRAMVERADENGGRAVIIPDLIALGGIENHITAILRGLSYAWNGKPLCPDPDINRWILKRAAAAFPRS